MNRASAHRTERAARSNRALRTIVWSVPRALAATEATSPRLNARMHSDLARGVPTIPQIWRGAYLSVVRSAGYGIWEAHRISGDLSLSRLSGLGPRCTGRPDLLKVRLVMLCARSDNVNLLLASAATRLATSLRRSVLGVLGCLASQPLPSLDRVHRWAAHGDSASRLSVLDGRARGRG